MRKSIWMLMFVLIIAVLAGCSNGTEKEKEQESEEVKSLGVEFKAPEKADVDETVELKAIVTYGDENVKDADEVKFEYWEKGNEEDSTMIETKNNQDGTYIAEVSFDHDGVYEMFAHTTAKDLHTMPKRSITIGEGVSAEEHHDEAGGHEHSEHTKGFGMHFMELGDVKVNQKIDLNVHLQMDNEPLKNANVRYEIFNNSNTEKHDWVETEESVSGEYTSSFTFEEVGTYTITIHVENDEGLHEHEEHKVEVNKGLH
ncbi:FixH family protein [Virgibacillus byunsanensis]|uniref:FixH family protein n=1 Tax=Virgibacillus byunsanensis TaxID=570945 RepID=A0ABW3LN80_9BACI